MKNVLRLMAGATALALVWQGSMAAAQDAPEVPNQPWYPADYHDLRIAAALQIETFPRRAEGLAFEDYDNPGGMAYDMIDCEPLYDVPEDADEQTAERMALALEVAKYRHEFAAMGFPTEVYDQPMLEYERWMLAGTVPRWAERYAALAARYPDGPPEDYYETDHTEQEDADMLALSYGTLGALGGELEARRKRLAPRSPRVKVEGGCGAGESEFEIRLLPANGELWLINAFAFRVCERKVADPWNHQACRWSQYGAGDNTYASGRYMYEARWPNGVVKRVARVLEGDPAGEEVTQITFRRD